MPLTRPAARFIPVWKEAPVLRLLVPLVAGILWQWYLPLSLMVIGAGGAVAWMAAIGLHAAPRQLRRFFSPALQVLLVATGAALVWLNDTVHQPAFIGRHYQEGALVLATLQEPLQAKQASYKAEAQVAIWQNGQLVSTAGRIILYFKRGRTAPPLTYGSQVLFARPLQRIRNAGNPGGFDYQRYCRFHHLFYQVFLAAEAYVVLPQRQINPFRQHLFAAQQWVLSTFRKYIPGHPERGMAEALLIGYRNDLDRDLVQQYSNTGVVHIIAISGMHLGLIYWLVLLPFRPFRKSRPVLVLQTCLVLAVLWFFSLLTGASPSILRSAVMFSVLALGQMSGRRSRIYNNLALSALLILLADPFSLWDVGFQLSYAAVLSIAIFAGPLRHRLYVRNRMLRQAGAFVAVTIAAQLLTWPLVAYHFHQFPTLFLLTNLVAVPLSTLLIFSLIALLALSFWSPAAAVLGRLVQGAIQWLNSFIDRVDGLPFSLVDGLLLNIPETLALYLVVAAAGWWWLRRSGRAAVAALLLLAGCCCSYTRRFTQQCRQQHLVVYNVPKHAAIDLVQGRHYLFLGDPEMRKDGFLQHFYLKPARVQYQVGPASRLPGVAATTTALQANRLRVVMLSGAVPATPAVVRPDVLLLTGNPAVSLEAAAQCYHPKILVADGTCTYSRVKRWQQEARRLHLRLHVVAEQGAYVQNW